MKNSFHNNLYILALSAKERINLEEKKSYYQRLAINGDDLKSSYILDTDANGHRAVIATKDKDDFKKKIIAKDYVENIPSSSKVAFLFTGQGSSYIGMGKELYDTCSVYKEYFDTCCNLFEDEMQTSLSKVIFGEDEKLLSQTLYMQPAIFSVEYALAKMWKHLGVTPDFSLGHSIGEYVAAHFSGVMTLEDTVKLVAKRARLMQSTAQGKMAALRLDGETITEYKIQNSNDDISIAAKNSPFQTVISGSAKAITGMVEWLERKEVMCKVLPVSHGFHSYLMDPILDEFKEFAKTITYHQPTLNFVSNLTGELHTKESVDADYWAQHLRSCVEFAKGIQTLKKLGCNTYVEVGSQAHLSPIGKQCLGFEDNSQWLHSLRSDQGNWESMLSSISCLYTQGTKIHWDKL